MSAVGVYTEDLMKRFLLGDTMTRLGIEPGSMQPQCIILTTVRSSPTNTIKYTIRKRYATLLFYHFFHHIQSHNSIQNRKRRYLFFRYNYSCCYRIFHVSKGIFLCYHPMLLLWVNPIENHFCSCTVCLHLVLACLMTTCCAEIVVVSMLLDQEVQKCKILEGENGKR